MNNQGTDKSKPKTPKLLGPKSKRNETDETKPKTPKFLGPKSKRHETEEPKPKTAKLLGPKSMRDETDDETKPKIQKLLGPKSKRKVKITSKENISDESKYQETDQTNDDTFVNDLEDINEKEFVILSEETKDSLSCPVCFEIPKYDASIKASLDDPTLLPLSGVPTLHPCKEIYQCENGHTVCADCHKKMTDKNCPQCRTSMFKTRFTLFVSENFLRKLSERATNEPEMVPLSEETVCSLKCPKCFTIPGVNKIYQCENGHMICFQCYSHKSCQECQLPMKKTKFTNFVSQNVLPKLLIQCPFIECPKKKKWSKIEKHKENCQFKVKKPLKIGYKCTICKKDHFRSLREFTFHTMKSHAKLGKKELKSLINRATLPPSKRNPLPL